MARGECPRPRRVADGHGRGWRAAPAEASLLMRLPVANSRALSRSLCLPLSLWERRSAPLSGKERALGAQQRRRVKKRRLSLTAATMHSTCGHPCAVAECWVSQSRATLHMCDVGSGAWIAPSCSNTIYHKVSDRSCDCERAVQIHVHVCRLPGVRVSHPSRSRAPSGRQGSDRRGESEACPRRARPSPCGGAATGPTRAACGGSDVGMCAVPGSSTPPLPRSRARCVCKGGYGDF